MVRKLLYLNGWATLMVVLYHASAWGYIAMFWWVDRYRAVTAPNFDALGSGTYYSLRFVEALVAVAIPVFLFVSGFFSAFAAGRSRQTIGFEAIFPRIKNLFIPYFLWSCVYMMIQVVLDDISITPVRFVQIIFFGQAEDPFYFVPVIIQLYLISPLIIPWAKKHPWLALAASGALQLVVAITRYWLILGLEVNPAMQVMARSWFFAGFVFWFVLGMVFGFYQVRMKEVLVRWRWALLAVALASVAASMVEWETLLRFSGQSWIGPRETLVDQIYSVFFLLAFIGFENIRLPLSKTFSYLGQNSFGVYLVHTLGLIAVGKLIYRFAPVILDTGLGFQVLLYAAGLGLPLILMRIVDRSPLRRLYSTIFG